MESHRLSLLTKPKGDPASFCLSDGEEHQHLLPRSAQLLHLEIGVWFQKTLKTMSCPPCPSFQALSDHLALQVNAVRLLRLVTK